MVKRILGVLLLRSAAYREIAKDPAATRQAAVIVVLSTLVFGFFEGFIVTDTPPSVVRLSLSGGLSEALARVIPGLIIWAVVAWILAFLVKLLKGETNAGEMLRITGYAQAFGILAVLGILALTSPSLAGIGALFTLLVGFLSLLATIIGIVEVSGISTGKAFFAALVTEAITLVFTIAAATLLLRLLKLGG